MTPDRTRCVRDRRRRRRSAWCRWCHVDHRTRSHRRDGGGGRAGPNGRDGQDGRDGRDGQRGAATVLAVGLVGVLLTVTLVVAAGIALVVDHRRAQAAADLAALAGAQALAPVDGGGSACGAAGSTADANGARLVACTVVGRDVRVRVEVDGPNVAGLGASLVAEARAGPANPR